MNIHNITNTIFIEDKLKKSDVLLIPGSSELGLAEKACQLYLQKYANMIVVSGGFNKKLSIEDNEASYLKRYMIKKGIPEHKIIVDTFASNTQENAENSKIICEELDDINSAIIVCKNYHAGRVKKTYEKYFISGCDLMICPVIDSRNVNKKDWWKRTESKKIVLSEFEKLNKYFKTHES
ncbi:hypothetical protein BHU61_12175 [Macrococcus epidermidis]|uniref:DUF218 domain-containing protein n=1 Tax=Macrococcus epidermidis TaxID=1902580 RepID=A0A327ZND1_9STAP|nr:YdcF family protein [Macrococcus epidermidis]RAK43776.1 hypothetical protein BHU61_12175 [Macrococcus epidermidis]